MPSDDSFFFYCLTLSMIILLGGCVETRIMIVDNEIGSVRRANLSLESKVESLEYEVERLQSLTRRRNNE